MDYKKIAVLLLRQDATLQKELSDKGIGLVSVHTGCNIRESLNQLYLQPQISLFLMVDSADHFFAEDILQVANAAYRNPSKIFMGERSVPEKKSLAQKLYCFLAGVDAPDITSSLIAIPREYMQTILTMKSKEKIFLHNISLEARAKSIAVETIQTQATLKKAPGFEILKTAKLYMVFIKFSISALISYLVDIGTFYLFQKLFSFLDDEFKILTATILSRILCSIATYVLNKSAVFQSQAKSSGTAIRFVILAMAQLVASWLLVWGLGSLLGGGDEINTALKIVVDLLIFLASFTLQRDWVFKETTGLLK